MILSDILQETFWSLSANKVRSSLTILGIVIGIASVITMVSIGQGAQSSIAARIQSIGSNLIVISPGAERTAGVSAGQGSSRSLTLADATALKAQVQNVSGVAPEDTHRYQLTAGGNNTNVSVIGTVPDYPTVRNITVDTGTFLTEYQVTTSGKVVVLGPTVRDDLFGADTDPIGKTIRIKNIDFQVIGMTLTKGGSGFANPDNAVYVPISTAQHYLSGDDYVTTISVSALDTTVLATVQQDVIALLLQLHGISDPTQADFSTINQADIIATASSVTGTFTILLASIAGISLLVGGIGIMNMMLTTVTERTREIGLRKAVGIRKEYILWQFLSEAVTLTFFGGILGVVLGWGASLIVSHFAGLATVVAPSSIFLAFGVSAAVGIVFGFYPARRAANLTPMDALRYE
jgi:putative ABC transport system permease protein